MSLAAEPNVSLHQNYFRDVVTQTQFESLMSKFDALSFAHKRLESRVSELEEELLECQEALRAERQRTQDITHLATQQLQEWTLEGEKLSLHCKLLLHFILSLFMPLDLFWVTNDSCSRCMDKDSS